MIWPQAIKIPMKSIVDALPAICCPSVFAASPQCCVIRSTLASAKGNHQQWMKSLLMSCEMCLPFGFFFFGWAFWVNVLPPTDVHVWYINSDTLDQIINTRMMLRYACFKPVDDYLHKKTRFSWRRNNVCFLPVTATYIIYNYYTASSFSCIRARPKLLFTDKWQS